MWTKDGLLYMVNAANERMITCTLWLMLKYVDLKMQYQNGIVVQLLKTLENVMKFSLTERYRLMMHQRGRLIIIRSIKTKTFVKHPIRTYNKRTHVMWCRYLWFIMPTEFLCKFHALRQSAKLWKIAPLKSQKTPYSMGQQTFSRTPKAKDRSSSSANAHTKLRLSEAFCRNESNCTGKACHKR